MGSAVAVENLQGKLVNGPYHGTEVPSFAFGSWLQVVPTRLALRTTIGVRKMEVHMAEGSETSQRCPCRTVDQYSAMSLLMNKTTQQGQRSQLPTSILPSLLSSLPPPPRTHGTQVLTGSPRMPMSPLSPLIPFGPLSP